MTTITVPNVMGTGTYAVPTSDAEVAAAQTGFAALLGGVAGLTWSALYARVESTNGGAATRTLTAFLQGVASGGNETLNAADTQTLLAAIENALLADAGIVTVGTPLINMSIFGLDYLWKREGGLIQPVTSGDMVVPSQQKIDEVVHNGAIPTMPTWTSVVMAPHLSFGFYGRGYFQVVAAAATTQVTMRPLADSASLDYSPLSPLQSHAQCTPVLATGKSAYLSCPIQAATVQIVGTGSAAITLVSVM